MLPVSVVSALWSVANLVALAGAVYMGLVAFRDWRIVSADTRDMKRRLIRRETSGILVRSGVVRSVTCLVFVAIGVASVGNPKQPSHVSIAATVYSLGLAFLTVAMTVRDLIARARIAKANDG